MSSQKMFDYLVGLLIAGLGIAISHYMFHLHD